MHRRPNHLFDVTTPEIARRSIERKLQDPTATLDTLLAACNMAILQGHATLARDGFQRVLNLAEKQGDLEQKMLAQIGLGTALHALQEHDQASNLFRQAIATTDTLPNITIRGFAMAWLASCQAALGNHEAASENLANAMACADVIGNEELTKVAEAIRQKLAR